VYTLTAYLPQCMDHFGSFLLVIREEHVGVNVVLRTFREWKSRQVLNKDGNVVHR
jgi:hypothetical protein